MPDLACSSCGVLHCLHITESHKRAMASTYVLEAVRSARTLSMTIVPLYPMHLEASPFALDRLGTDVALWTSHATLAIVPELQPMLAERRKLCQALGSSQEACIRFLLHNVTDSQSPWPFVWKVPICQPAIELAAFGSAKPHFSKLLSSISHWLDQLSALLRTPFMRTLFLDADTYVLWPPFVHALLHATLPSADVAMPLDVGRTFAPWNRLGPPPLCSCVVAYRNNSLVRGLFLGAAERLIRHR